MTTQETQIKNEIKIQIDNFIEACIDLDIPVEKAKKIFFSKQGLDLILSNVKK